MVRFGGPHQGFVSPLGVFAINKQSGLYYALLMLWKTATSATQRNQKQSQEAEENTWISFATIWMQPPFHS